MTEVEELLLDWLYSFLTREEQDRLMGWHLGVSLIPLLISPPRLGSDIWLCVAMLPGHWQLKSIH